MIKNKKPVKAHSGKTLGFYLVRVVLFVGFLVLIQLFRWQILQYDRFEALATAQVSSQQDILTKRGTIYTQDGVVLAVDSPSWRITLSLTNDVDKKAFLNTKNINDDGTPLAADQQAKEKTVIFTAIAQIIGEPVDVLNQAYDKTFNSNKPLVYQVLYTGITKRQKDMIEAQHFPGIYTEDATKRLYPNGQLFSNLIGYVGTDSNGHPQGNYGIEGFFWGDIKGKDGTTQQEKDLSNKAIISTNYKNIRYREGKNIVLTVNSGIQEKVEKLLAQGIKSQRGDSGSVTIMDPKTGKIIAMATYPTYNPNQYWQVSSVANFLNTAVSSPYEFGSVMKPLTIAMAMTEGKLTADSLCNDTGKLKVEDKYVYNFAFEKYGKITPKDTLRFSDNICAAQYGLSVGAPTMYNYLVKLGFGTQTGIGIDEEETSYLKAPEKWLNIDTATISFGQTISSTPLQFASAMSTIANHGVRMQPMLVQKIYNNEDSIDISPTSDGQVFPRAVADSVASMMEYAAMSRREFQKYRGVYDIAGKTGTAQVAKTDGSGYYNDRVNVTYVGFAPAKDARFIMVVKIANPRNGNLANLTVLPVWLKIFDAIKDDLGVPRVK